MDDLDSKILKEFSELNDEGKHCILAYAKHMQEKRELGEQCLSPAEWEEGNIRGRGATQ